MCWVELLMRTDGRQIEGKSSCKAIAVPPRRGQRPNTSMAGCSDCGALVDQKDDRQSAFLLQVMQKIGGQQGLRVQMNTDKVCC